MNLTKEQIDAAEAAVATAKTAMLPLAGDWNDSLFAPVEAAVEHQKNAFEVNLPYEGMTAEEIATAKATEKAEAIAKMQEDAAARLEAAAGRIEAALNKPVAALEAVVATPAAVVPPATPTVVPPTTQEVEKIVPEVDTFNAPEGEVPAAASEVPAEVA